MPRVSLPVFRGDDVAAFSNCFKLCVHKRRQMRHDRLSMDHSLGEVAAERFAVTAGMRPHVDLVVKKRKLHFVGPGRGHD